jgi:hypothetical protein
LSSLHRTDAQRPQTCIASTQALRSQHVFSTSKSPDCVDAHGSNRCSSPVRQVPTGQTGQTHRSDWFGAVAPPSSVLWSWFCGSTKEPSGYLVNHRKPRELGVASANQLMTRLPRSPGSTLVLRLNQETVHDFILPFLPPCSPHLTPLATRSLKPSLLVFSTRGSLTGNDLSLLFFTCTNTSQVATCTCNT